MAEEYFADMVKQSTFDFINTATKDIGEGTILEIANTKYRSNLIMNIGFVGSICLILYSILYFLTQPIQVTVYISWFILSFILAVVSPIIMKKTQSYKLWVFIFILVWLAISIIIPYFVPYTSESGTTGMTLMPIVFMFCTYDLPLSIVIMHLVWCCQIILKSWSNNDLTSLCPDCEGLQEYMDQQFYFMVVQFYWQDALGVLMIYVGLNYSVQIQNVMEKLLKKTIQSEKSKDMFIAAMSHEFRSPLNSMLCSIELLLNGNILGLTPTQKDLLVSAQNCSEILLHLINNVLDVCKLQSGGLDLAPTNTDLRQSILKLLSVNKSGANKKGLKLEFKADESLPKYINIDSSRLNQVLINLISNAIKFTNKGLVQVIIEYMPDETSIPEEEYDKEKQPQLLDVGVSNFQKFCPETEVSMDSFDSYIVDDWQLDEKAIVTYFDHNEKMVKSSGMETNWSIPVNEVTGDELIRSLERCIPGYETRGFIKIHVKDSGIGMTQEEVQILFQPFVQANESIWKNFGGTGLGLWLSQQIIKIFDGEISIESETEIGSIFTVSFPVEIPKREEQDDSLTNLARPLKYIQERIKGCRLLVAEDLGYNQGVFYEMLRSLDCVCTIVSDGIQLIEMYQQFHKDFDVVLTDFDMPRLDGIGASKEIRQFEKSNNLREIPIIVITANATSNLRKLAQKSGCNDFLVKPIDRILLAKALLRNATFQKTIMCIDDDKLQLDVLSHMVTRQGFAVKCSQDPRESLENIINNYLTFSAIILDHNMPGMTGLEVASSIRQWEENKGPKRVPIIMLSGDMHEDFEQQRKDVGINEILLKPVSQTKINEILKQYVNN